MGRLVQHCTSQPCPLRCCPAVHFPMACLHVDGSDTAVARNDANDCTFFCSSSRLGGPHSGLPPSSFLCHPFLLPSGVGLLFFSFLPGIIWGLTWPARVDTHRTCMQSGVIMPQRAE